MPSAHPLVLAASVASMAVCVAAAPSQQPPHLRPTDLVSRNITHMSPLLSYAGDVEYVYTAPHTPDGSMGTDMASHHVLRAGASAAFTFAGSTFAINGWADGMLRVREYPLDVDLHSLDAGSLGADSPHTPGGTGWIDEPRAPEAGRDEWWRFESLDTREGTDVSTRAEHTERTLVALLGDGDDGPRRVRLDVTQGEVWLSRVLTQTDVPPSDEWGAPHWPILEGWRGVREYMGARVEGLWRETYVDFADIGLEQPVAWALGRDGQGEGCARVTLSPAVGASYLELRGASPSASMGAGRFRVHVDPALPGHRGDWHAVPAGQIADIVLFSAPLDASLAYTVTLEAQRVGWHWASAWFLAEMGVQPMPRWIGRWGRVRRVLESVRARVALMAAVLVAIAAVGCGFVLARRPKAEAQGERQPLLADVEDV